MTAVIEVAPSCTACGLCIVSCPEGALVRAPGRPLGIGDRCTACLACVEVCPVDAVDIEEVGS